MDGNRPVGRVLQVNVSAGGVPKLPIERAWVGRLGLEGDAHREVTVHGGPHRAVCLFAIEAIERLQAEGHPVEPGSVGENLTTTGVEWSLLPVGTRAQIGEALEIELSSPVTPCATQTPNFLGGRFNRILIDRHPSDSRMYARVIHEGEVKPGDAIAIHPPADSRAQDELSLGRLERAETKSSVIAWRLAQRAGFEVHILEDGELAMVATPAVPGPAFNSARGLARLPNLIPQATRFFDEHRSTGWLVTESAPWPGSVPDLKLAVYAAEPSEVADAPPPRGVTIRRVMNGESPTWDRVHAESSSGGIEPGAINPWPAVSAGLTEQPHVTLLLAEQDGAPVGAASLYVSKRTAWMRAAAVVPRARGRGIQRSLIAARAAIARDEGCELIGASAEIGSVSARNMERTGLVQIGLREHHRYVPRGGGQ